MNETTAQDPIDELIEVSKPKKARKKPEPNPVTTYKPARCGHRDCGSADVEKSNCINRERGIWRIRCRTCGRYSVIKPESAGK